MAAPSAVIAAQVVKGMTMGPLVLGEGMKAGDSTAEGSEAAEAAVSAECVAPAEFAAVHAMTTVALPEIMAVAVWSALVLEANLLVAVEVVAVVVAYRARCLRLEREEAAVVLSTEWV